MKIPKIFILRFSIRTLMLAVLIVSILFAVLALWLRSNQLRELAADHHVNAMENGYRVGEIHFPVPHAHGSGSRVISPPRTDTDTIAKVVPLWLSLMRHEEMRDTYLDASRKPWCSLPSGHFDQIHSRLSVDSGSNPREIWKHLIKPYIDENGYLDDYSRRFDPGDRNHALSEQLLSWEQWGRATGIKIIIVE